MHNLDNKLQKVHNELAKLAINEGELNYIHTHQQRWIDVLKLFFHYSWKKTKVLDVGIGGGWMSILIKNLFNCDACGVDIDRTETYLWADRLENLGIKFNICDITKEKLPYPNETFDVVLLLEVLEHLITSHPPYEIFDEIKRCMKPNSHLILSTPNSLALHKRFLALLGKNPLTHGFKSKYSYKKHFREYTVDELKYVLNGYGFRIDKIILKNYVFLASNSFLELLSIYPRFKDTITVICTKGKKGG